MIPFRIHVTNLKSNKSLRNGTLFSLFSVINQGFSFLILLVLASFITPTEYGYLSLFATVTMVIGYFMAMMSEGYLSVSYFSEGETGIKKTFTGLLVTSLTVASVLILILLLFGNSISTILKLPLHVLFIAVILSFFYVFTQINLDLCRIQERVVSYGLLSCSNAFLNFVISIVIVKYLMMGWEGRVYTQGMCSILFGCIGLFVFIKNGFLGKFNAHHWKLMMLWGIPLIPHAAANFIKQGMDRYIIDSYHSIELVGLFSFALNLVNIIIMLGNGFNQSNGVEIYKVLGDNDLSNEDKEIKLTSQIKLLIKVYIFILIAVILGVTLLIPVFMPNYTGSIPYFLVLSAYGFMVCLYLLYSNFLFYYKKTKNIMYITFSVACIHLLMSLLITRYSLFLTCALYCLTQGCVSLLIRHKALAILKQNEIALGR